MSWIIAPKVGVMNKLVRKSSKWDDLKMTLLGHHMLSKAMYGYGLHTNTGMLWCRVKDKEKDNFQYIQGNMTTIKIEEGIEEYIKNNTPIANYRIVFNPHTQ